ncbi:MAG: flippase [Chloroflexales bacterium]|nr:flippase [Chloroflexales bacterium]
MMRLWLFLGALIAVLLLTGVAVLLWRRFYRDDPQNAARRVFKNSAVPLALRMLVRGFDLVFAVVLLGTLAAADIGPYTLAVLLVAQYLGTFTEFGLGVFLTREVARDPTAAPRLFGVTLALRWLLVFVGAAPIAALLIGGYSLLAQFGLGEAITPIGREAIWVLLLTLIPSAYSGAVTALYNASERMEIPALIELVTAILSFLVRIGVLLAGFGIIGLAWVAVAVSTCTALLYLFLQMRDFFRPTLSWDNALIRQIVPTALPLMLNSLLGVVFFRFDIFIIRALGGEQSDLLVQQYGMPYQVLGIALILPPVITFAVFPMLARRAVGERTALVEAQNRTLQALLLLAFPIAMGIALLAPDLVWVFTRDQFADYNPISIHVLAILAWFLPLSFVNGLLQYVLIAINQQRAITRAFVIGAAFNLSANLLAISWLSLQGVPQLGLYAASVITILSEIVLFAVFAPLLRREELMPPLLALAWRPILAALAMGLAMLVVFVFVPRPWASLVMALVSVPVYGVALWLLGAFGTEERALAMRIIGRAS